MKKWGFQRRLINLITNAVRYSYEGSTVYLTITETDHNVLFSVRDTGQGILPEYQERVFNRYFKVPGSSKSGTGLGFAISKEFIEAQGGNIFLKSEYGEGCEFMVSLNKGGETPRPHTRVVKQISGSVLRLVCETFFLYYLCILICCLSFDCHSVYQKNCL